MSTRKKLGLALLFLFAFSTTALATDYYVKTPANGGDNANNGLSWATAKATITAAINLINNSTGNTVKVAAGTFNEKVTFPGYSMIQLLGGYPAAGGDTQAPWTNKTILDGNGLAAGPIISIPYNTSGNYGYLGLVIDGFTITRGTESTMGFSAGGIRTYSVGLTISRCIIENNTNSNTNGIAGGIYAAGMLNENLFSPRRTLRIDSCIIRNNSAKGAGGIAIDAIGGFKFHLINTLIYSNQSTVTDPLWAFGVGGVVIGTGSQMMAPAPDGPKIINCTIANNIAAHSVKVGGVAVNLEVGETVTIHNSIIWHSNHDDLFGKNGETFALSYSNIEDIDDTGTGVIHLDPSFVSATDFHLNPGSPCIDTGNNGAAGLPATDLEGNARIIDGDGNGTATVDMGAYEFQTHGGPPPDIDFNGDDVSDLAGLTSNGLIFYTTNLSTWTQIPGVLNQLVVGDFNGDSLSDLAGLASDGTIWYTTNLSTWTQIPGVLNQLVVGDFDGDGKLDDLAGLTSDGNIYYTTNLSTWTQIPGTLNQLVVGDYDGDDKLDDLAGLTSDGNIYYTTNLSTWTNIPGTLAQLVSGDINPARPGYELAGLATNGSIWFTTDFSTWSGVSGALSQLVLGDFDGDGSSDLAGLSSVGAIYYTTYASDFLDWNYIPGVLELLVE